MPLLLLCASSVNEAFASILRCLSSVSLQDAWTPLKVASAVAAINLAGDYYLIIQKDLGVVGAGITCPVAQYFGAIVFMVYLYRMGKREKGIPLSWQVPVTAPSAVPHHELVRRLTGLAKCTMTTRVSLHCVPVLLAGTVLFALSSMICRTGILVFAASMSTQ